MVAVSHGENRQWWPPTDVKIGRVLCPSSEGIRGMETIRLRCLSVIEAPRGPPRPPTVVNGGGVVKNNNNNSGDW